MKYEDNGATIRKVEVSLELERIKSIVPKEIFYAIDNQFDKMEARIATLEYDEYLRNNKDGTK